MKMKKQLDIKKLLLLNMSERLCSGSRKNY